VQIKKKQLVKSVQAKEDKMSNLVKIFEGQEVKVKTDKGETLINLVHVAKCCGLVKNDRGFERIRWELVRKKLGLISGQECDHKIEIKYILEEIENTDDRNSIYMSSWLSKRLAIECHSPRANKFKDWLVTLDEARENGQIVTSNNEISNMIGQVVNQIIPNLTENLALQLAPIVVDAKNQVNNIVKLMHDQSTIYDQDREDLKSLIGFRAVNTKRLSDKLKEELSENLGMTITANSSHYLKAKEKIFKQFKVIKWEDIPAIKYNTVYAYIEEIAN
jgi:prophage antirepressor-like protein